MYFLKALQIIISIALIALLISKVSLLELRISIDAVMQNIYLFFAAILTPAIGFYVSSVRLRILSNSQNVNFSVAELLKLNLIASFYNQVLPSTVGGDIIRGVIISKSRKLTDDEGVDKTMLAVTLIGVDRLIGIIGLLLTGVTGVMINPVVIQSTINLDFSRFIIVFILAGVVGGIIYTERQFFQRVISSHRLFERIIRKGKAVVDMIAKFSSRKRELLICIVLSIIIQAAVILEFCLIARSMELPVDILEFAIIIPIVDFFSLVPISINGIGVRENTLFFLGARIGITAASAVILAYLYLAIKIMWGIIGGIVTLQNQLSAKNRTIL